MISNVFFGRAATNSLRKWHSLTRTPSEEGMYLTKCGGAMLITRPTEGRTLEDNHKFTFGDACRACIVPDKKVVVDTGGEWFEL